MTLPESVSLMFLLCVIEAADPPTMDCTFYFPKEEDARKGFLPTMRCGPSKREVMETKNEEDGQGKGNGTKEKIVDVEKGNGEEAVKQKEEQRKIEISNGSASGMKNNETLDQKPKPFEDKKPPKIAVLPSTKAKRSPCNGRSKKCKGKRQRPKKSKKRNSRRRRAAKAQRKRRH